MTLLEFECSYDPERLCLTLLVSKYMGWVGPGVVWVANCILISAQVPYVWDLKTRGVGLDNTYICTSKDEENGIISFLHGLKTHQGANY